MRLDTVTTQSGVLSAEAKAKLAVEVTLDSEYAGVPKNWVHMVFHDFHRGSGLTGGELRRLPRLHFSFEPADQGNTTVAWRCA
jgi:phenylpyruvate tautomerase PptA (4-oxalocrotonate tautomerase family)